MPRIVKAYSNQSDGRKRPLNPSWMLPLATLDSDSPGAVELLLNCGDRRIFFETDWVSVSWGQQL